ncbi:MAG: biotin/lipoyl-binding protein [Rhodospirillales bacterium]|nr:biotin/lipoyl-binding protein [Rhodospirillales bacterium]
MEGPAQDRAYLTLLQLEKEARDASSNEALGYTMVNRARVLVPYRQAILFRLHGKGDAQVQAISDVPTPDQNAPFVRWLKRIGKVIADGESGNSLHEVAVRALPERDQKDVSAWLPAHLVWCPLSAPDGVLIGSLLIARDEPWGEVDGVLMGHIAGAWGHAWAALLGLRGHRRKRAFGWGVKVTAALFLAIQFIPVMQTALAPAEVVGRHPELVAAPMDGVIKTVHVAPNSPVSEGDLLFSYDDTSLSGRLEVAEEELLVARTALRTAQQGAFGDQQRNAEVALLEAQVSLRMAERNHIHAQVARKDVRAGRSGVALFREASDLEGRPVATGERVMLIAGPYETELRIELPVADAVALQLGAPVRLFLDRSPLTPLDAVLEHVGYEAEVSASGVLSYRLVARFADGAQTRIGLRGTAKIEGSKVPLYLYLFRRPIAALRQWIGF